MSAIAVFGAGGQLGRLIVAEAVGRGHTVTAVVRNPSAHPDLTAAGAPGGMAAAAGSAPRAVAGTPGRVVVEAGDVRDPERVAELAASHDVVVASVYTADEAAADLYPAAARALLAGVATAPATTRLLVVGVVSTREASPGVLLMDTPGFPAEAREFSLARAAELALLQAAPSPVDWLLLLPPMEIDRASLAVDLLNEIETPRHHRSAVPTGD